MCFWCHCHKDVLALGNISIAELGKAQRQVPDTTTL